MKKLISNIIISSTVLFSAAVLSQSAPSLCPIQSIVTDGCTNVPEGELYENTLTPACANHDSCYATVGADKNQCDSDFKSEMYSICARKYGGGFRPDKYYSCKAAADYMYTGVQVGGAPFYIETQTEWQAVSNNIIDTFNDNECVTMPETSGIFDQEMVATAKGAIESATGKHATTFQLHKVLQEYNPGNYSSWENSVANSAYVTPYITGILKGEAKLQITQNTSSTVFSTTGSTGTSTLLFINGKQ